MNRSPLFVIGTILFAFSSCQDDNLVRKYCHIPEREWNRHDTCLFAIPEVPHTGTYDLKLGLRFGKQISKRNIILGVEQTLHNPEQTIRDTLTVQIRDEEGNFPEKGVNLIYTEQHILTLHLKKGQHGTISIHRFMLDPPLRDIADVGILITPQK